MNEITKKARPAGIENDDTVSLAEFFGTIWAGRWIVVGTTALLSIASVIYALVATEWFEAEVLLAPAERQSPPTFGGQFGGLATLAGLDIGGEDTSEPIAVLRSRGFARDFINDNDLLTVLLEDRWDAKAGKWKGDNPEEWPDVRDGVTYFDQNVRTVRLDAKTGMVTLGIQWKDPVVAADWANALVGRLNDRMRNRALVDAEKNVAYLRQELGSTGVITLQQAISRLLETELQRLMLARGSEEFALRIIDAAEPPKRRSKPKRALLVIVATVMGGMIGVSIVFLRSS